MIINNGHIFTPNGVFEKGTLTIDGDTIQEVLLQNITSNTDSYTDGIVPPSADSTYYDASDCYIIPGLIDLHFHGCMGYDACDGTLDALRSIRSYQLQHGITSFTPATMTLPEETLHEIVTTIADFYKEEPKAALQGIYLEGPFLSPSKKGAQNSSFLDTPDIAMFERLQVSANNLIKTVAIAPELPGAIECIRTLHSQVTCTIAHTACDYTTAMEAFAQGARQVTHLYNAMLPLHHREPGVIGAAFDAKESMVELICDGHHIHPAIVRATFQLFGEDRVLLVSDCMSATGMPDGSYELGGQEVSVQDSIATLHDGTLAGSTTNLLECMRRAIHMGISPSSAIKAATINPAKALGIASAFGSISKNKIANLLILNSDFTLRDVFFYGTRIPR